MALEVLRAIRENFLSGTAVSARRTQIAIRQLDDAVDGKLRRVLLGKGLDAGRGELKPDQPLARDAVSTHFG